MRCPCSWRQAWRAGLVTTLATDQVDYGEKRPRLSWRCLRLCHVFTYTVVVFTILLVELCFPNLPRKRNSKARRKLPFPTCRDAQRLVLPTAFSPSGPISIISSLFPWPYREAFKALHSCWGWVVSGRVWPGQGKTIAQDTRPRKKDSTKKGGSLDPDFFD